MTPAERSPAPERVKRPVAASEDRPEAKKPRTSACGRNISVTCSASHLSRVASSQNRTLEPATARRIEVSKPKSPVIVELGDDAEQAFLKKIQSTKRLCMKFPDLIKDPRIHSEKCRDALVAKCFDYLQSGRASFDQTLDLLKKMEEWKKQHWLDGSMQSALDIIDDKLTQIIQQHPTLLERFRQFQYLLNGIVRRRFYYLVRMLKAAGLMDDKYQIADKPRTGKVINGLFYGTITPENLDYVSGYMEVLECMKLDKAFFLNWVTRYYTNAVTLVYGAEPVAKNKVIEELDHWLRSLSDSEVLLNELEVKDATNRSCFRALVRLTKGLSLFKDRRLTLPSIFPGNPLCSTPFTTQKFDEWITQVVQLNKKKYLLLPLLLSLYFGVNSFRQGLSIVKKHLDKDGWRILIKSCPPCHLKFLMVESNKLPVEALADLVCRCLQAEIDVPEANWIRFGALPADSLSRFYLNPFVAKELLEKGSLPEEPSCRATLIVGAHDLPKARDMLSELKSLPSPLTGDVRTQWAEALRFLARLSERTPELATELLCKDVTDRVGYGDFIVDLLSINPDLLSKLSETDRSELIKMRGGLIISNALQNLDDVPDAWIKLIIEHKADLTPSDLSCMASRHVVLCNVLRDELLKRCCDYFLSLLAREQLSFATYLLEKDRQDLLRTVDHPDIRRRLAYSEKMTLESAHRLLEEESESIEVGKLFKICQRFESIAVKVYENQTLREKVDDTSWFTLAMHNSTIARKLFLSVTYSKQIQLATRHQCLMRSVLESNVGKELSGDELVKMLLNHGDIITMLPNSPSGKLLTASHWAELASRHKTLAMHFLNNSREMPKFTPQQLINIARKHVDFARALVVNPYFQRRIPLTSEDWVGLLQRHESLIPLLRASTVVLNQEEWEAIGQTSVKHFDLVSQKVALKTPRPVESKERFIEAPERHTRTFRQTFQAFRQSTIPDSMMGEISSEGGCCAGFVLDFIRFSRKYASSFPAVYPTDYARKAKRKDKSFARSFIHRVLHYQHNQDKYRNISNDPVFTSEQPLEQKSDKLVSLLGKYPELYLHSDEHAIGIVFRVDPVTSQGHYFVFDSNRGIYHFDGLREASCVVRLIEEWLLSTEGCGNGKIWAQSVKGVIDSHFTVGRYKNLGSDEEPLDLT